MQLDADGHRHTCAWLSYLKKVLSKESKKGSPKS